MKTQKSEIDARLDELAKRLGETGDPKVKAELLRLTREAVASEKAAALAVLEGALARCRREDMRTAEVLRALDYLQQRAVEKWPFVQFLDALQTENEEGRWQTLNASLNGIKLRCRTDQ